MNTHFHIDPLTARSKRLFDVVLASSALLIALPLLPFIAIAIKANSPRPVFFTQMRIGKGEPDYVTLFEMIKFVPW